MALYWAYDGTPSLCAPPRLYNQIIVHIAQQRGTNGINLARLLALANTAMADAGIAKFVTGTPKKVIFVPRRLLNIVL